MKKELLANPTESETLIGKILARHYGWEVIERYEGLNVDRHDDTSCLKVMLLGKWQSLGDVSSFLQIKNFIAANTENQVWCFVSGNGVFAQIKPEIKVGLDNGTSIEIYAYHAGIMVFCFDKAQKVTSRHLFLNAYFCGQTWSFVNQIGTFRLQIREAEDGNEELYPYLAKLAPRYHWYWPFWKF